MAIEHDFPQLAKDDGPVKVPDRLPDGTAPTVAEASDDDHAKRLVWDRRTTGISHTARVCPNGALQLSDGSIHATPSAAITDLGGLNTTGWKMWRVADGRTWGDLRTA
jgi:hypothetical protein